MNYLKVYCNLIRKAEKRTSPEGYVENHHIFPKSIFGKNNKIVVLTGREHYIAHALLEKAFIKRYGLSNIKTQKMIKASWCMNNQKTKNTYLNSHLYESSKIRYIENIKGENHHWYGKKHSQETRKRMKEAQKGENHSMYGKTHSQETKEKMSKSHKGRPSSKGMLGKKQTEEAKQKIRESKEVKSFSVISPTGEIIHSKNTKQFCRDNNLNNGHFSQVLNGKRPVHKGFRLYTG
jgi:group I intron endonuclease